MVINRLIAGFRSFRETYYDSRPEFYQRLVEKGQHPVAMVIACSDSRVNPSIIAGTEPGELFIVRNVANLVPPYEPDGRHHGTSTAIEFAVRDLGVADIIVLGHSHCGGVRYLCESDGGAGEHEFMASWMSIAQEARDESLEGEARLRHAERETVKISLQNLLTFPWIADRVAEGRLGLHGWWFDLAAGDLLIHEVGGEWKSLASAPQYPK
jgi:carbonic anhydrase|tara:strand:- start:47 stop:679 length:633 start_codon:yes stop_codon:yes gene_type:complete